MKKAALLSLLLCLLLSACTLQSQPDFTAMIANADRVVVHGGWEPSQTIDLTDGTTMKKILGGWEPTQARDPKEVESQLRAVTGAAARALDDCRPMERYVSCAGSSGWGATFYEGEKQILRITFVTAHERGWVVAYELNGDTDYFCCDYGEDMEYANDPPGGIVELIRAFYDLFPADTGYYAERALGLD